MRGRQIESPQNFSGEGGGKAISHLIERGIGVHNLEHGFQDGLRFCWLQQQERHAANHSAYLPATE